MRFICSACGVQHADSAVPPDHCDICADERQFVPRDGQKWTTLKEMQGTYRNQLDVEGPELISKAKLWEEIPRRDKYNEIWNEVKGAN